MPEITPSHFDLVILGTGLQAALLAGRAALAGKTVLHLDQADHYGGAWSSLSWEQLQLLAASPEQDGGLFDAACGTAANADLGRLSSYAFDLALRVLYCAGPAIEALVTTGAHHYLEFKLISGNYFWNGSRLQSVPAGRSDVFQDRSLSLTSKRMLMRFLKNLQDAMEGRGPLKDAFDDTPFVTLLERQGLDEQLRHVLLHAIALSPWGSRVQAPASSTEVMTAAEGQRALAQHAASMGRFGLGTGAFLTPLYGGSEMSQAFCRVAAVHGALYVLRQPVDALLMDPAAAGEPDAPRKCRGVRLSTGQEITCGTLAADPEYLAEFNQNGQSDPAAAVSRAVCILDQPLQHGLFGDVWADSICVASGSNILGPNSQLPQTTARDQAEGGAALSEYGVGGQQVLMTFPPSSFPGGCQDAIHALQLSPACAVTPPDRYLLQVSAPSPYRASAATDLVPLLDALLEIPHDVRQALINSSPHMPVSTTEDSQAGVSSNQALVFRAAETSGSSSASSQAAVRDPRNSSPASAASRPPVAGSRAAHAAGGVASTSGSSHTPRSSSSAGSRAPAWQDGSSQENLRAAAASKPGATSGPAPALDAASPHPGASSALPAADDSLQGVSSLDEPSTSVPDSKQSAAAQESAAASSTAAESAGLSETHRKRPAVLFAACWTQHIPDRAAFELPGNVAMCSPPDAQITFDAALTEVDGLIDRLYGSGTAAAWASKRGLQDDESDEEAVEALSHALEQTATID